MARKYHRDSRGRFAGGGGGSSGGSRGGGHSGGGGKAVGRAGSKAMAHPRTASKHVSLGTRTKRAAGKATRFVKKHPVATAIGARVVVMGAVGLATHGAVAHNSALHSKAHKMNSRFAHDRVAAKRGIGQSPVSVLKAARRTIRGVQKITTMK